MSAYLDAVLDFPAMEDAFFWEVTKVRQGVQVHAEQVLPLQHSHALRVGAVLLRQLQPLCTASSLLVLCMQQKRLNLTLIRAILQE